MTQHEASRLTLAINTNSSTLPRATHARDIMVLPGRAKRWIPRTVITPDYTNQLDLFSETPLDDPSPVAAPPAPREHHVRPRPPQQLDFGTLEPLPPFDAGPAKAAEPPAGGVGEDSGTVRGSPVQADIRREDGIPPGLGNDDRRIPPAGREAFIDEPEPKPSRDFRITEAHRIGWAARLKRQKRTSKPSGS